MRQRSVISFGVWCFGLDSRRYRIDLGGFSRKSKGRKRSDGEQRASHEQTRSAKKSPKAAEQSSLPIGYSCEDQIDTGILQEDVDREERSLLHPKGTPDAEGRREEGGREG